MCPECSGKGCEFRKLSDACDDAKMTYFFDNPVSIILAFISPIACEFLKILFVVENVSVVEICSYLVPRAQLFLRWVHGYFTSLVTRFHLGNVIIPTPETAASAGVWA